VTWLAPNQYEHWPGRARPALADSPGVLATATSTNQETGMQLSLIC